MDSKEKTEDLKRSLRILRSCERAGGGALDFKLVVAPVLAAIDEFIPETVKLLRDAADEFFAQGQHLAAAQLQIVATHIEQFLPE